MKQKFYLHNVPASLFHTFVTNVWVTNLQIVKVVKKVFFICLNKYPCTLLR